MAPVDVIPFGTGTGLVHYAFDIAVAGAANRVLYPTSDLAAGLEFNPEFMETADGWVQSATREDAPPTSGSTNPRSEGRETAEGTGANLGWQPGDGGTHWQRIRCRVMEHPLVNNVGIAIAQLHSSDDDILMVRTRYSSSTGRTALVLRAYDPGQNNTVDVVTLDTDYSFGDVFDLLILVRGPWAYVFYQDFTRPVYRVATSTFPATNSYFFKWGNYIQATTSWPSGTWGRTHHRNVQHWHTGGAQPLNYFNAPTVSLGSAGTAAVGQPFTRTAGETGSGIVERRWAILEGPTGTGTEIGTAAALSWTPTVAGTYVLVYGARNTEGWSSPTFLTVTATGGSASVTGRFTPAAPLAAASTHTLQTPPTTEPGNQIFVWVSSDEFGAVGSGITNRALIDPASAADGWVTDPAWTAEQSDSTNVRGTLFRLPSAVGGGADELVITLEADPEEVAYTAIAVADGGTPIVSTILAQSAASTVTPPALSGLPQGDYLDLAFLALDANPMPVSARTVTPAAGYGNLQVCQPAASTSNTVCAYSMERGYESSTGVAPGAISWIGGDDQSITLHVAIPYEPQGPALETHRFYLTNTNAPWAPGVASGFWDDTTVGLLVPHHLGETPAGSAASVSRAETSTDGSWFVLLGQWVSHPANSAGSLVAATIALVVGAAQSASNSDLRLTVNVWVSVGSTAARRGTALNLFDLAGPFPTTAAGILFDDAASEVAFQPGDRIGVELGFRGNTLAASHTGTLHIGGTGIPDLAEGSTTLTRPGWIDIPVTAGVEFLPSVAAAVAAATGTGSAGPLSAAGQATGGGASGSGAALTVGGHVAAAAGTAAGSGSAGTVVGAPSVASVAGAATGAGSAGAVVASVRGAAGSAVGAGTAGAPRAALVAAAAAAAGSGSVGAPAAGVLARAAAATGVGSALGVDGIGASAPSVAVAHGTGSAGPVQARVHSAAAAAVGSGSAGQAVGRVAATAAQAGGTGSAAAVGAVIAGRASTASGVGSAGAVSSAGAVFADAGTAAGTGVAAAATARVSATAGTAAGAGTAGAVTSTSVPTVNAQPATAVGTGAAGGLSAAAKAAVGAAVGAGGALSPAARIVVLGLVSSAAGTGAAGVVLADVDAAVSTAAGSGTVPRPEAGVPGGALSASGIGTAGQVAPSTSLARTPSTAGGVGAAGSVAASVTARPGTASGTATAAEPSSTSIAVRDALAGMASGVGSAARVGATLQAPTTAAAGVGSTGPAAVRVDVRAGAASGVGAAGAARTVVAAAAAIAAGAGSAPVPDSQVVVVGAAGAATGAGSAGGVSAELVSKVGASSGVGRVLAAAGSVSARAGTAAGVGSSGGVGVHLAAVLATALGEGSASEVRGPDSWVLPWRVTARRLDDRTAAAVVRTP